MLALLLVPAALALDPATTYDLELDVDVQGSTMALTLHDVQPGPLPGFSFEGQDGLCYRLTVDIVEQEVEDQVTFELMLEELRPLKRDRWESTVLSRPRITTVVGQEAELSQGRSDPAGGPARDLVRFHLLLTEQ